jgi:hypothetical protein
MSDLNDFMMGEDRKVNDLEQKFIQQTRKGFSPFDDEEPIDEDLLQDFGEEHKTDHFNL